MAAAGRGPVGRYMDQGAVAARDQATVCAGKCVAVVEDGALAAVKACGVGWHQVSVCP